MTYFCLDCEASGPVPPLYNLLSVGVTVVRPVGDHHELGESFYAELRPIFPGFDAEAMAVCGLDAERLRREGRDPREFLEDLAAWTAEQNRPSRERPANRRSVRRSGIARKLGICRASLAKAFRSASARAP